VLFSAEDIATLAQPKIESMSGLHVDCRDCGIAIHGASVTTLHELLAVDDPAVLSFNADEDGSVSGLLVECLSEVEPLKWLSAQLSCLLQLALLLHGKTSNEILATLPQEGFEVESVVDSLFSSYIAYCGVSVGLRTVIWYGMVESYHFADPTLSYEEVVDRINKRFDHLDEKYKKYDIGYVSDHSTLFDLVDLLNDEADRATKEALIIGIACMVLNGDRVPSV